MTRSRTTRRLVVEAVSIGILALGVPAAVAAQAPAALPLRDAREIVVVDAWHGYASFSPTRAAYTLHRLADGSFAGTVQISVGNGLIRRDTSFAVQLSRAAADSMLQQLSQVPLQDRSPPTALPHTDDYPSVRVELTVGDSVIGFYSRSQGQAHVPWRVRAGGRTYWSGSEAIWSTISAVLGRIGQREEQALIQAVRADPEADCGHARSVPPWMTQRLRYAAGEAWFARDSSITVQGRSYRKHGLERVVGFLEITPYASYRGVLVLMEVGITGTPEVVYLPATASCRVQAYTLEPRP